MMKREIFAIAAAGFTLVPLTALVFLSTPVRAMDLNSFRAQHKLPALSVSGTLSAAAFAHANDMASRKRLDHKGFRARVPITAGAAAENVAMIACARPDAKPGSTFAGSACGCDTEDCAIRMWSRSGGHRANMLRRDVTSYGIATAEGGMRYWVLELGN